MKNNSSNTKKVRFLRKNDKIRATDFVTGCGHLRYTKAQWREGVLKVYNRKGSFGGFWEVNDLRPSNVGKKVKETDWTDKTWIIARVY